MLVRSVLALGSSAADAEQSHERRATDLAKTGDDGVEPPGDQRRPDRVGRDDGRGQDRLVGILQDTLGSGVAMVDDFADVHP